MTETLATKYERPNAKERLTKYLRDYPQLFFVLRHRSKSGMARYYDIYCFCKSKSNSERLVKLQITHTVSEVTGYSMHDRGNGNPHDNTLKIGGAQFCAVDEITTSLSYYLFGDSTKLKGESMG